MSYSLFILPRSGSMKIYVNRKLRILCMVKTIDLDRFALRPSINLKICPPFRVGHNISHKNEITQNGEERSHVPHYDNCITSHFPPRYGLHSNLGVECRKAAIAMQMWISLFYRYSRVYPTSPFIAAMHFPGS